MCDNVCTNKVNGVECDDQGLTFDKLCDGCKTYWRRAAFLANKSPEQWLKQNQKDVGAMDPNACLTEMLDLANRTLPLNLIETARLQELVNAMDNWMTKGGFLPQKWGKFRK